MIRTNTFRATKSGAWRGGGSYSDSLYRTTTAGGDSLDGWELCTLLQSNGVRVNLRCKDRLDVKNRRAKWLDEDHRWVEVALTDENWERVETSEC